MNLNIVLQQGMISGLVYCRIVTCTWSKLANSVSESRGSCIENEWGNGERKVNHKSLTQKAREIIIRKPSCNNLPVSLSFHERFFFLRGFEVFVMRPHSTRHQLI